jgi:hypothetical protein
VEEDGIIVVSGQTPTEAGLEPVVSVLRTDGSEMSRTSRVVSNIAYDGVQERWYFFEPPTISPGPDDVASLAVLTLDRTTGEWSELSALSGVPVPTALPIVALNDRLAYVGIVPPSDGGLFDFVLVLIDTSDHDNLTRVTVPFDRTIAADAFGLVGARATTGQPGGFVSVVARENCAAVDGAAVDACDAVLRPVSVGSGLTQGPQKVGAQFASGTDFAPGAGSSRDDPGLYLLAHVPPTGAGAVGHVKRFTPSTLTEQTPEVTMNTSLSRIGAVGYDGCHDVALVAELTGNQQLWALSMVGAGNATKAIGHQGQTVYYEPFTSRVLVSYRLGGLFGITAFALAEQGGSPSLTKLVGASWSPPNDLQPYSLAVRHPYPFPCN